MFSDSPVLNTLLIVLAVIGVLTLLAVLGMGWMHYEMMGGRWFC